MTDLDDVADRLHRRAVRISQPNAEPLLHGDGDLGHRQRVDPGIRQPGLEGHRAVRVRGQLAAQLDNGTLYGVQLLSTHPR